MADEKVSVAHEATLDASDPSKSHPTVIDHARSAAAKEQSMTLMQGIKLYPKAVGWSILISTCIVMVGVLTYEAYAWAKKVNRKDLMFLWSTTFVSF